METKFTKGPWTLCQYDSGEIVAIDKEDSDCSEIICDTLRTGDEEWDANAHLIAASPDMYKEIEQDILWLERLSKNYVIGSYELRSIQLRIKSKRILLTKARGEE